MMSPILVLREVFKGIREESREREKEKGVFSLSLVSSLLQHLEKEERDK
jgi:DNA repair photolyase